MEIQTYYIPLEVRFYIVSKVIEGYKYDDIIEMIEKNFHRHVSKQSISAIFSKYQEFGTVADLPRCGRPCTLSEEQEKRLIENVEQNPKLTANSIAKDPEMNEEDLSSRQLTRILNANGLLDHTSVPQSIKDVNKANRLKFAIYQEKNIDWDYVIFSDESDLFPDRPGKIHYRKRKGENIDLDYGPDYRHDPRKVKVWGTISRLKVGTIHRYEDKMKGTNYVKLLEQTLIQDFPLLRGTHTRRGKYSFQQDKAGPHISEEVEIFFRNNHIHVIDWPSESPDLSPIENVWHFIKAELYKMNNDLSTADEAWEEIKRIWYNDVKFLLPQLYNSMPNRFHEVIKCEGGRISY